MRLFFGMEVISPWPEENPSGRILLESDRHLTLAFLGESTMPDLPSFPKPPFQIGLAGIFDKPLFLSHVAAWHIHWLEGEKLLLLFQKNLSNWLHLKGEFLSHVTMARKPYDAKKWEESFRKLPLFVQNIHLYESLGYSKYKSLWSYPLLAPFEEIEHTADIAFRIRGNLFLHAQLALSFHFPSMIDYFDYGEVNDLGDIVTALNAMIARADSEIGCPFKAVSFHDIQNKTGEWEMIVDV